MLQLLKIDINNFQKHAKLTLDFTTGVNVIWGASRTGKSCIRRAIEWVIFNQKIDSIRKEGTKKTSVKLYFSGDINLEKIRSQSINRYILEVGKDIKQFDAIGKEVPDEIKTALNLNPIVIDQETINLNIAPQITLPFLLDKAPSFRMKLFNLLTGNDLQDKLLGAFNKSLLGISRSVKSQDEILINSKKEYKEVEARKQLFSAYVEKFKVLYNRINCNKKRLDLLQTCSKKLSVIATETASSNDQLKSIRIIDLETIDTLNNKILQLDKLSILLEDLEMNDQESQNLTNKLQAIKIIDPQILDKVSGKIGTLEKLTSFKQALSGVLKEIAAIGTDLAWDRLTEVDFEPLLGKINRLKILRDAFLRNQSVKLGQGRITGDLNKINADLKNCETDYDELLQDFKICPLTKIPMPKDCLDKIKL